MEKFKAFFYFTGYKIPKCKSIEEYRNNIEQLPLVDSPECFGLHSNADITYQTNTSNNMLATIVNIQPKDSGGGGGETREMVVYRLAEDMLEKLPDDYVPYEVWLVLTVTTMSFLFKGLYSRWVQNPKNKSFGGCTGIILLVYKGR